jgi:hypothetical protein
MATDAEGNGPHMFGAINELFPGAPPPPAPGSEVG